MTDQAVGIYHAMLTYAGSARDSQGFEAFARLTSMPQVPEWENNYLLTLFGIFPIYMVCLSLISVMER